MNSSFMRQHLELISAATWSGRHAVVIMDGAGWHTDNIIESLNAQWALHLVIDRRNWC